jgi:hypothetical protein
MSHTQGVKVLARNGDYNVKEGIQMRFTQDQQDKIELALKHVSDAKHLFESAGLPFSNDTKELPPALAAAQGLLQNLARQR